MSILPMSRAEQDNKIRSVINALVDHAPTSLFEAKLVVQMLTSHEVIIACQHRLLNQYLPTGHSEVILKHSLKALEVFTKQLDALDMLSMRREVRMKSVNNNPKRISAAKRIGNSNAQPALPDSSGQNDPRPDETGAAHKIPSSRKGGHQ